MQGTTSGSHTRDRPKTTWMDNILQWTGYTLDKTLMYSEDSQVETARSWCGQALEQGWLKTRQGSRCAPHLKQQMGRE